MSGIRAVHGEQVAPPDTSRNARLEATRRLPLDRLDAQTRQRIAEIVERPTLYRRMPIERIPCDPSLFVFLVRYPEVVVNMWELMGATKIRCRRIDDYMVDADDGSGTLTRIELVYGTPNVHLLYAEGEYSGPLMSRRVTGRCVLALQSSYQQARDGRSLVTSEMDVFLNLEGLGAEVVAKTLHPVMGKTADHNFAESAKFIEQVSEQAALNNDAMQDLADRLTRIRPDVRKKFVEVVERVPRVLETDERSLTATNAGR